MKKILPVLLFILCLSSCRTQKDVLYFQNINHVINSTPDIYEEPKIQVGDELSIIVVKNSSGINGQQINLAQPYNMAVSQSMRSSSSGVNTNAYLVDADGNIEMPEIGKINVAGLTRNELSAYLRGRIEKFIENPIINIRILNYRVTMLGEFNKPGVVNSTSDKLSVIEAIAMSGDMSLYAIRDSVMIIRTENGVRSHAFINLKDANLINSEFYYLKQNDILYAMPNKSKSLEINVGPLRSIMTVFGFALTIIALFR